MNLTAIFALLAGLVMVLLTQAFEGSSILVLIQPTAFFIVIGGTFCAALLNFNYETIRNAFNNAKSIFYKEENRTMKVLEDIVKLSYYARKNGVFALQDVLSSINDGFLARGLQLAIDLNNPQLLYDVLSSEIAYEEEEELISSRVFEALGGYAPTFGVVGAVMGLIHVMSNIQNIQTLGNGIATAFVSTLYGVGFANLVLLPIAGNLKQKTREKILLKEVMLQGILSIVMQENPAIIEEKLVSYLKFHHKK
ncbi:MAG: flagellar motor protein [Candidatus Gastranaerophilales bacterium]|nr:flagellar motor protein [Candidatus Gastranaerophilales bacterium]